MDKLTLRDVYPPSVYEPVRDDMRKHIIALKRNRRVGLGPNVTLVFENRATLIFQVCEMLRAEHIVEPARIQDELDVYNSILPEPGQLSATLFVEITDEKDIRPTLSRMVGIDAHVALVAGGERVPAEFEAGRSEAERISSVQYVRFRLSSAARHALGDPAATVELVSDLAGYSHRTVLDPATRQSLASDLA